MNRVILGDCMEGMKRTPDKYYDLSCVDPPYGIGVSKTIHHQNNTVDKITKYTPKEWDNNIPTSEYWRELFRVSENQIIWGGNYFTEFLKPTKDWIIWDKEQPEKMHFAQAEMCWCSFGRGIRIFKRSISKDQNRVSNNRIKALKYRRIHPTQKPIALYDWIFKNYAEPGMKVLDSHAGSMSSVISAIRAGLTIDCYEIDKDYYEAGKKRVTDYFSQLNAFESQPQIEWINDTSQIRE